MIYEKVESIMKPIACIILPTYNEAENIESVVTAIFEQQDVIKSHDLHVLVVDGNSTDGTEKVVKFLQNKYYNLHLINEDKKGIAEAYKSGIQYAVNEMDPELLFEMDADGQHDPSLIPTFISLANHGFSLVIGSRFAQGGDSPNFTFVQKAYSLFGNWLVRVLGGVPRIRDCTSGYRCIKTSLIKKCNMDFEGHSGYTFQSSFLFELVKNGAKVVEVPIIFANRMAGETKLTKEDRNEFIMNIIKMRYRQSEEFIKFCFVGASGVIVNLGIYIILTRLFGVNLEIASPIAIECSIITNFLLNNSWTFRQRNNQSHYLKKLCKFHIVAGIAGIFNYVIFLGLIYFLGFHDILANLLGITFATLINYVLNSIWTWRHKTPVEE